MLDPEIIKRISKTKNETDDSSKGLTPGLREIASVGTSKGTEDLYLGDTAGVAEPKLENRFSAFLKKHAVAIVIAIITIVVSIGLGAWIVNINSVVKPIEKNSTNIATLQKDVGKLEGKDISLENSIKGVDDEHSKSITKLELENKHLVETDKELKKKDEGLEEKLADHVSDLKEADNALIIELNEIKNNTNNQSMQNVQYKN